MYQQKRGDLEIVFEEMIDNNSVNIDSDIVQDYFKLDSEFTEKKSP